MFIHLLLLFEGTKSSYRDIGTYFCKFTILTLDTHCTYKHVLELTKDRFRLGFKVQSNRAWMESDKLDPWPLHEGPRP